MSEQLNLLKDSFIFLFQRDLFGVFKSYNGTSYQFIPMGPLGIMCSFYQTELFIALN